MWKWYCDVWNGDDCGVVVYEVVMSDVGVYVIVMNSCAVIPFASVHESDERYCG